MNFTIRQMAGLALAGLASFAQAQPSGPTPTVPAEAACQIAAPQAPAIEWRGSATYRAKALVRAGRVVTSEIAAQTAGVEREAQRAMVQTVGKALQEARCTGDHEIDQLFIFNLSPGLTTVTSVPTPASAAAVAANETGPPERCRFGVEWTGACINGVADGDGRLEALDAEGQLRYRHEGRLRAGRRDGDGVTTRADGSRVEGSFSNDRLEGHGRIVFANGDIYDGDWRAGLAAGEGQLTFARGDAFAGQLHAGRLAKGLYRWANGASYSGSFANNLPSGPGELRFADGATLTARFLRGVPDGPVRLRTPEGGGHDAEFRRGLLKTSRDDVPTTAYLRLQRLRMPSLAPMGVLSDSRNVPLACSGAVRFSVPDVGWKGRAVYRAAVEVKAGVVQHVTVTPTQPSGDAGVDKRYVEALEQAIKAGTRCNGDARIERNYIVELR